MYHPKDLCLHMYFVSISKTAYLLRHWYRSLEGKDAFLNIHESMVSFRGDVIHRHRFLQIFDRKYYYN